MPFSFKEWEGKLENKRIHNTVLDIEIILLEVFLYSNVPFDWCQEGRFEKETNMKYLLRKLFLESINIEKTLFEVTMKNFNATSISLPFLRRCFLFKSHLYGRFRDLVTSKISRSVDKWLVVIDKFS